MSVERALTASIMRLVRPGCSVIDIGSGLEAPYHFGLAKRAGWVMMLDAHKPYLDANVEGHRPNVGRTCGVLPDALTLFSNSEFDVALLIDIIEHFDKPTALMVMNKAKRIARAAAVFTPLGTVCQDSDWYGMGGDQWQTHRSGWTTTDLTENGFQRVEVWTSQPENTSTLWAVWRRP